MSVQDKALMLEAMEAHDWDFDSMAVSNGWLEPRAAIDLEVRADYAESLLCAMAFDHQSRETGRACSARPIDEAPLMVAQSLALAFQPTRRGAGSETGAYSVWVS